jgi:hypothetical protein
VTIRDWRGFSPPDGVRIMANAKAVVDSVSSLSFSMDELREARRAKPIPKTVTVQFQAGQSALLDMAQPRSIVWAEVLHSMREAGHPAYVEIDPETNQITELRWPLAVRVGEIRKTDSGAEAELIISHARHYLQRGQPNFNSLLDALENARRQKSTVLVTETDDHQIIDVRTMENGAKKPG